MVRISENLTQRLSEAASSNCGSKGAEGIARVFFCTLIGRRIVMLHSFIKKSDKTPAYGREIAEARMKEIKRENA